MAGLAVAAAARVGLGYAHAGEWTPRDIGAALTGWWRADLGVQLNGSKVSALADQSGRGGHFSQGNISAQPPYLASGLNGHPAVDFTGSTFLASTLLAAASGSHLIVAVLDVDSVAVNRYVFDSLTGRIVAILSHGSTANGLGYVDGSFRSVGALPSTGAQVIEWDLRASPGGRVFVNGTQKGAAATYVPRALGGTSVIGATAPDGSLNRLDARLYELIIASGHTDDHRTALRRYVASRYAFEVAA